MIPDQQLCPICHFTEDHCICCVEDLTIGDLTANPQAEHNHHLDGPHYVDQLPDSGQRRQFATGAVRDVGSGKGRFDLLAAYAILRKARHYENGAAKYDDRNWEKGIPCHCFLDSALRHLFAYMDGDRSEDHLAAAGWNIDGLIWTEEMIRRGKLPKELNDLPTPSTYR